MSETTSARSPRMRATLRREERITALELFFDLVFVLAITQCTALMAKTADWEGLGRGLLVLAVLWWAWVGYAWLTSVVDPEEGGVRIVMFGVMASLLVVSLCVPRAFGSEAALFVAFYGIVRFGQLALFWVADRDDPNLRRSIAGLAVSSSVGVGILFLAALADGALQGALWGLAIFLDFLGPFLFGSEGWRLAPRHFAERHALIVIIALGESIVAIGVGAGEVVDAGVVAAAVVGVALTAGLWWLYFDVSSIAAERNLSNAPRGQVQNEIARDGYSYIHFLLVAGVVLAAFGMKKTLGHVDEHLKLVPAVALCGGAALYLLGLIAFRLRNVRSLSRSRVVGMLVLLALIPVATHVPAIAALSAVAATVAGVVAYEAIRFAETPRDPPPPRPRSRPRRRSRLGAPVTRQLWAPWRLEYIVQADQQEGCVFCLESAGALGADSLVVHRGETAVVLLNKFPYSSGHLMVAPVRHVGELEELSSAEAAEVHACTVAAIAALRVVSAPDAFNVGWNLGAVAGGSIAAHLHEHVVPRWAGDTNFMPVLADVKVVPEHLLRTRDQLREAWPA